MGFAGSQSCGVALPLIVHLFKPRQVAQPRVVILVELSLSDVFFFHAVNWRNGSLAQCSSPRRYN
jgi:hypothetical protein